MEPTTLLSPERPTIGAPPTFRAVVHDTAEDAAAAGWDEALPLPPFLSTDWLRAFAPQSRGGAGGPSTQYVQLLDQSRRVRLQCLSQVLPVRRMSLGDSVSPRLAARALGAEAHQVGQALFSGPAYATDLDGAEAAAALASVPDLMGLRGACFVKDVRGIGHGGGWTGIGALPEMRLPIAQAWHGFEDYVAALPSKYRRRLRRARRKFADLSVRTLDVGHVTGFSESLTGLYGRLIARTPYVPYVAPAGYVSRLKALRPDVVTLLGYFDGGRLVGFATLLRDGREGLAHLAAVDPAYNETHQLYLNLLFDLLERAIAQDCDVLNYGRTATTIKSSVGATPVYYASVVRHTGCVRNGLLRRLVPYVLDPGDARAVVQRPLGD